MNPKQTWTLLGISLALFAFIVLHESRLAPARESNPVAPPLIESLDSARVTSIEIVRTNGTLRAVRSGTGWMLASPSYPAQNTKIQNLLESLESLTEHAWIPEQELDDGTDPYAPFGFAPPSARITLHMSGGQEFHIEIGAKTPIGGRLYAKTSGREGVAIIEASILAAIPSSADDWRDRTFAALDGVEFNRIEILSGTRSFELQRGTNTPWRFTKPMPARADASRVQWLLQQIHTTRVQQFVSTDPGPLEQLGLEPPEAQILLALGTNDLLQLQFGRASTNDANLVFARRSQQPDMIVLVRKERADLLRLPPTYFRDRTLLTFNPDEIRRIDVDADAAFALRQQAPDSWLILDPFQMPGDPELIRAFLDDLARIEVVEFVKDVVTDFSEFGLAQPSRRYQLYSETTNAAGLTNILASQVHFSTNAGDKAYASRPDEPSVYAVAYGDLLRLPRLPHELRHRKIWSFSPTNVASVQISQKGRTRILERKPAGDWGISTVHNAALEETLFRLGKLEAVDWVGRGEARMDLLGFVREDYKIQIQLLPSANAQPLSLAFGSLSPQKNPYAAVIFPGDSEPTLFEFPPNLYLLVARNLSVISPADIP